MNMTKTPTHQQATFLAAVVATVVALAVSVFSAGCAQSFRPGVDHIDPAGSAIEVVDGHVSDAAALVDKAKPHADDAGKGYLTDASGELADAKDAVATVRTELSAANAQLVQARDELVNRDAKLDAYKSRWTGDLFQRWVKRIVGVLAGLAVAGVVLNVIGLTGAGPLKTAFAMLGRGVNLVVPVLGGVANWVADHVWLKKVKAGIASDGVASAEAELELPAPPPFHADREEKFFGDPK